VNAQYLSPVSVGLTRCRVCKCTEMRACFPPCYWEPGEPDLCDRCAETIRQVQQWLQVAVRPSFAALKREAMKANAPGHAYGRLRKAAKR